MTKTKRIRKAVMAELDGKYSFTKGKWELSSLSPLDEVLCDIDLFGSVEALAHFICKGSLSKADRLERAIMKRFQSPADYQSLRLVLEVNEYKKMAGMSIELMLL